MAKVFDDLEKELGKLQTTADRLRVKLQLGKAEVRDLYEDARQKLQIVRSELDRLDEETDESGAEIRDNLSQMLREAGKTFKRIQQRL